MSAPYDPTLSRQVVIDIEAAIKASIAAKGAPKPLSIPHDGVPLQQLFFVLGWEAKPVPSEELGLDPGLLAFVGWPDGVEEPAKPTWALVVQVG